MVRTLSLRRLDIKKTNWHPQNITYILQSISEKYIFIPFSKLVKKTVYPKYKGNPYIIVPKPNIDVKLIGRFFIAIAKKTRIELIKYK
jgi:hypothetical protein